MDIHDLDPSNPAEFPFASAEPVLLLNPEDAAKFRDSASKNTSGSPKVTGAARGGNGLNFVDLHGREFKELIHKIRYRQTSLYPSEESSLIMRCLLNRGYSL